MGRRRDRAHTPGLWIATNDLPATGGHPFYRRLNQILDAHGFDAFVEAPCAAFYAKRGRPSLGPGLYVRLLLIGYFEGLDSERGIAWRAADSLALRGFLGLGLTETLPGAVLLRSAADFSPESGAPGRTLSVGSPWGRQLININAISTAICG